MDEFIFDVADGSAAPPASPKVCMLTASEETIMRPSQKQQSTLGALPLSVFCAHAKTLNHTSADDSSGTKNYRYDANLTFSSAERITNIAEGEQITQPKVDHFVESSKVLMNALDEVAKVHPVIQGMLIDISRPALFVIIRAVSCSPGFQNHDQSGAQASG
jgi:hypothetical protein